MKRNFLPFILIASSLALAGCPAQEEPVEVSLESISLSGSYRTEYYVGEEYDPMGLKVYAHYSDQSQKQIAAKDYVVTGFDSSVAVESLPITVTYTEKEVTKSASFSVTIKGEEEVAKVTVNIELTTVGIEEYSGTHSTLWINSSFKLDDDGNWTSYALTQDEENPNLWKYTFEEVEVDQIYSYNFLYGSELKPRWGDGKNLAEDGSVMEEGVNYTFELADEASDPTLMAVTRSFNVVADVDPEDAYIVEFIVNHDVENSTATGFGLKTSTTTMYISNMAWQAELVSSEEEPNVFKVTYYSDEQEFNFGINAWGTDFTGNDGQFNPVGLEWVGFDLYVTEKGVKATVTVSDTGMNKDNPRLQVTPVVTGAHIVEVN